MNMCNQNREGGRYWSYSARWTENEGTSYMQLLNGVHAWRRTAGYLLWPRSLALLNSPSPAQTIWSPRADRNHLGCDVTESCKLVAEDPEKYIAYTFRADDWRPWKPPISCWIKHIFWIRSKRIFIIYWPRWILKHIQHIFAKIITPQIS
jgi:hypothetical protein